MNKLPFCKEYLFYIISNSTFDYSIKTTDNEVIVSDDEVRHYLLSLYSGTVYNKFITNDKMKELDTVEKYREYVVSLFNQDYTAYVNREQYNITMMYRALTSEYNPIHNYDRTEEYTDTKTNTQTGSNNVVSNNSNDTTGYNVPFGSQDPEKIGNTTDKTTGSADTTSNMKIDESISHNAHLYGNIGVTTTQNMLNEEIRLRIKDNIMIVALANFIYEKLTYMD